MRSMAGRCGPWRGVSAPMFYAAMQQAAQQQSLQEQQQGHAEPASSFVPPVDIYEDEQSIMLQLEVPGMSEADIKIQLEGSNLEVTGERKLAEGQKRESFRRMERTYGSFRRLFRLPSTVEADKVTASYANGVLTVTLNKKPELQPKMIPVARA